MTQSTDDTAVQLGSGPPGWPVGIERVLLVAAVAAPPFVPLLHRLSLPYVNDAAKLLVLSLVAVLMGVLWVAELSVDPQAAGGRPFLPAGRGARAVLVTWATWLAVVGVSGRMSILPSLSEAGAPQPAMGVLTVAVWGLLFVAALRLARRNLAHGVLRALIWSGVAAAAVGIAQYLNLWLVTFEVLQHGRATSVFGSSIVFGGFLALSAPAAVAYSLHLRDGWEQRAVLVGVFVIAVGLAASGTRGAWIAAAGASALVVVLSMVLSGAAIRRRVALRALALGLVLVSAAAAAAVMPAGTTGTITERAATIGLREPSLAARSLIWKTVSSAALQRPWLGWGPDTTFYVMPRFQPPAWQKVFLNGGTTSSAHNLELQILIEYGLIGLAAFLLLLATCARHMVRALRTAGGGERVLQIALVGSLAGLLLHAQLAWVTLDVVAIAWILVGLAVGLDLVDETRGSGGADDASVAPSRRWAAVGAGTAVVTAAALLVVPTAGRALVADYYVTTGRRAFYSASTSEVQAAGIEYVESALRVYPEQADARGLLGRFYGAEYLSTGPSSGSVAQRLRRLTVSALVGAVRRNPYDAQGVKDYVDFLWSERRLLQRRPDNKPDPAALSEIIAYSLRGTVLEPWGAGFRRSLVEAYLSSGNPAAARRQARFLRRITPDDPVLDSRELGL